MSNFFRFQTVINQTAANPVLVWQSQEQSIHRVITQLSGSQQTKNEKYEIDFVRKLAKFSLNAERNLVLRLWLYSR